MLRNLHPDKFFPYSKKGSCVQSPLFLVMDNSLLEKRCEEF
ncbi:MAG: hypothetical protein JETT_2364 [Candidatus Jettenia ecosi]|uniref:Uncharacterized protein n=1 Tax=Candidatus Jettenia ecosi TaxID=2494326 RepID=A0A533Q9I0_9BACT|nr:MAG: hypothetical protein JETT_2364 [Candidatus Jettenia ecosi]